MLLAESRLEMLCSAIDVLLPASSGESCCHDSLLVLGALPIADLVPESTPEDIKAAMLDSTDVFLLDAGIEVFVWVGTAASEAENTADSAKSFLVQKGADTIAKRVCL